MSTFTRLFSFIGPNRTKRTLRIVKLVHSVMSPVVGWYFNLVNSNVDSKRRIIELNLGGGLMKNAVDGESILVSGSNLWAP
jgi:hypothetical protein